MPCIRPATPGFIVTLVATILLAIVSFCVPYFKSVFFLRADFSTGGQSGSITFGTLGYCLELANGTSCSKPSIGYELDINNLVGNHNRFNIEIPQVAVKWVTYALFLHVIALALAAISAIFGLLAHVREMSMACCSTCVSGFAAGIALIAFIFDIVLFFLAKARINAINGHASMGNAIWLTVAAWVLLFFSGCFFTMGRCCISKRGPRSKWGNRGDGENGPDTAYSERMRMEAIKADNERMARQAKEDTHSGGGLPAFYETVPLTGHLEGNSVYTDKDEISNASTPTVVGHAHSKPGYGPSGYTPAPQGSRAVDEYYNTSAPTATGTTYPPRPERQASTHSHPTTNYSAAPRRQQSGYTPTSTPYSPKTSPPPLQNNQYLSTAAYQDPYAASGRDYGHTAGSSSYHTAAGSHSQQPSSYSQYNNYSTQPQPQTSHYPEPSFNPDVYNSTGILSSASPPPMPTAGMANPYTTPAANPHTPPTATPTVNPYTSYSQTPPPQTYGAQRQYTLGGDIYGENSVPPLPQGNHSSYFSYSGTGTSSDAYPAPIGTNTAYTAPSHTNLVKGSQLPLTSHSPEDAPPGYDAGTSGVAGQWGKH